MDVKLEVHGTAETLASVSDTKPMEQAEDAIAPTSEAELKLESTLNIWILADCGKATHIGDFEVSATVLRLASKPFRRAFDSKAIDHVQAFPDPLSCVKTQAPSVVIFRESTNSFGLGLQASSDYIVLAWKNEIRNAMQVVLDILHLKVDHECSLKPWELALMAEVAFALDCVTPVLPWLNIWLPLIVKSDDRYHNWIGEKAWGCAHEYVRGIVGFVMGDANSFSQASWEWVGRFPMDLSGNTAAWSLAVFPIIKDTIFKQRDIYIQGLLSTINKYLEGYSTNHGDNERVRRYYERALGVFMSKLYPYLGKELKLEGKSFTWNGPLFLLGAEIIGPINSRLDGIPEEDDIILTSTRFWQDVKNVLEFSSRPIELQNYRPGAKRLLDVGKLVPKSPPALRWGSIN